MLKLIKRYGNTNVIVLDAEDMKIYELKEGDIVKVHLLKEVTKGDTHKKV